MRSFRVQTFALCTLLVAATAGAANPFYVKLLDRGLLSEQQGKHEQAVRQLRIAAFGLLDDLALYEVAQIHIALASEKLKDPEAVRFAADKLVKAERVKETYASLQLDATTRVSFDKLVRREIDPLLLADVAAFHAPVVQPKAAPQPIQLAKQEPKKQEPKKPEPTKQQPPPQVVIGAKESSPPPVTPPVTTKSIEISVPRTAPPAKAAAPQPKQSPEIAMKLAEARRLLNEGSMIAARQSYTMLAERKDLDRAQLLDVGKGLNQTGAWAESAIAYQRAQPFRAGDEMHMFYEAVNRYELGELNVARTLLKRALPALPASREVMLYRPKIESGL
ncbi:MAG TPA: hypothetical protein VN181_15135 [Thermoanaerobaculia bacterium]|nr:hypothetical protein [Thermoanaerobaculia bacterium]